MQFVSRFMSSKLSGKPESMKPLLDYLLTLNYRGEVSISVDHSIH
jgi:sucrose synthase